MRRHLWRQRAGDAVRVALWSTAALLLAAVALHLATRRVPAQPVWGLAALLWLLMLGRAALRMPSPAECALWADRHLQGQSAFSTWLEARNAARSDAAGRRLTAWASAQAVQSRRLLAQRQVSMHLVRPLLVMLVSAALAVLVQSLWHAEPARALADAASPAAGADPSRQPADTPAIGPAQADASALQAAAGVRQAQEDTLVDMANALAELASADLLAGHIADGQFAERLRQMRNRDPGAEIWGFPKRASNYRVYVTDARGIVLFDSSVSTRFVVRIMARLRREAARRKMTWKLPTLSHPKNLSCGGPVFPIRQHF